MATKQTIVKTIAMIQAAYSNFAPNQYTPDVFTAILGDIDDNLLSAAVIATLSEPRQFAPAPGEIRAAAVALKAQAAGIPSAAEAYAEVANMPAKMERYEQVGNEILVSPRRWSHPLVGDVAALIGWPRRFPTDNPSADRAQFYKVYEAHTAKELKAENQPAPVAAYIAQATQKLLTAKEI